MNGNDGSDIQNLHAPGMDISIDTQNQVFVWRGNKYHLISAGVLNNYAFAETSPRNNTLEQIIAAEIATDSLRNPNFAQLAAQLTNTQ